jgi:hypothetical protein
MKDDHPKHRVFVATSDSQALVWQRIEFDGSLSGDGCGSGIGTVRRSSKV